MIVFLIILTIITFVFIYYSVETSNSKRIKQRFKLRQNRFKAVKSKVNIYDLTKKLDSKLSKSIKCRESAEFYVKTTLCLHNAEKDVVSKDIWKYGFWEEHILSNDLTVEKILKFFFELTLYYKTNFLRGFSILCE